MPSDPAVARPLEYGTARIRTGVTGTQGPEYTTNPRSHISTYPQESLKGFVALRAAVGRERSLLVVAPFEVGDDVVRVGPFPHRVENEERLVGREKVSGDSAAERRRLEAVDEVPL
jgi:hypothetical protein